jgi:hypothetical protein
MGGVLCAQYAEEIPLDFESPSGEPEGKYQAILERGPQVLGLIEDYKGCRELIRVSMSTPSPENELAAFNGLLLSVDSIATIFEYAKDLQAALASVFEQLDPSNSTGQLPPLRSNQALAKQLAETLSFALQFDSVRMMRPNLSNDFSYYRRLLPKYHSHPDLKVKDDDASSMALFTAEHIPMLSTLTKAGEAYQDGRDMRGFNRMLGCLANSCAGTLRQNHNNKISPELKMLYMRTMAGCIVLYDRLNKSVFQRNCPIDVRGCVTVLLRHEPRAEIEPLLSAIKFSTFSYHEASSSLQTLLS